MSLRTDRYITQTLSPMTLRPVTLPGRHVCLVPLSLTHLEDLCSAGLDEKLWRFTVSPVRNRDDLQAYITTALREQAAGSALPFATCLAATGRAIGSTRFGNFDPANRRVEIGWTWIAQPWQRTAINTEAKYLMLRHAFETLGCLRVEFKTDLLNERSRRAILRLGAQEEGILRNHMITSAGRVRHSVYYSIIDSEWPAVKRNLEEKLARRDNGAAGIPPEGTRSGFSIRQGENA
ncbi:MAG: GNAT family N-acetyltransferase [candidate division KSB1 bacterium]|nr:GNAT family N-acetyltransferase [candidate division KSB1 bacterium]MDZ7272755.1 GNAT family N-acetyltransferase [candidate division KSB1 bacterium]MDZ7284221.1 GNAT family N-acetyltransferase [candidate division KSB1 bacterium]MDZ7297381.1 GNAT family N-acetyltransferase [candidate division KSB1 bacterium]MDZ7308978.1 GNAT family N-acetyltransferase [candidate division KSB1 bacterium]